MYNREAFDLKPCAMGEENCKNKGFLTFVTNVVHTFWLQILFMILEGLVGGEMS